MDKQQGVEAGAPNPSAAASPSDPSRSPPISSTPHYTADRWRLQSAMVEPRVLELIGGVLAVGTLSHAVVYIVETTPWWSILTATLLVATTVRWKSGGAPG